MRFLTLMESEAVVRYLQKDKEVEITGVSDFVPERIFECGQCFRWNPRQDGSYTGVAGGRVARVRTECGRIYISGSEEDFESFWRGYFDMDSDYAGIRKQIAVDDYIAQAAEFGAGIRILRQDGWEELCSFIISQCNNIGRIKGIVERLCALYGEAVGFEGGTYRTFPSADTVAALDLEKLEPLRCGYRAPYILNAARAVASGELDLGELAKARPGEAKERLKRLNGVGDKVADCVLLFGLHKLDAFPADVWIKRAIREHYDRNFDPAVFGCYSGIAQQYIFYYMRSSGRSAGGSPPASGTG